MNNIKNNICDEVNLLSFVLIIPIINNKLVQIINGIKHEYSTVNSVFIVGSSRRNNKTHCWSLR